MGLKEWQQAKEDRKLTRLIEAALAQGDESTAKKILDDHPEFAKRARSRAFFENLAKNKALAEQMEEISKQVGDAQTVELDGKQYVLDPLLDRAEAFFSYFGCGQILHTSDDKFTTQTISDLAMNGYYEAELSQETLYLVPKFVLYPKVYLQLPDTGKKTLLTNIKNVVNDMHNFMTGSDLTQNISYKEQSK